MSRFLSFLVLLAVTFPYVAEAGRVSMLPRQRLKSYETGDGSPRGFNAAVNANCINISDTPQSVTLSLNEETIKAGINIRGTPSGVTAWDMSSNGGWGRQIFSPASLSDRQTKLSAVRNLNAAGTPGYEISFALPFFCAFSKSGLDCTSDSDVDLFTPSSTGFGWDLGTLNKTATGQADCSGVTNCVVRATVDYTVLPMLSVTPDKGAVICSLYLSISLAYSGGQVAGEINTYFNAGRPF